LPQALLPLVLDGATPLNDRISVVCRDGRWTYFCGVEPVFFHDQSDPTAFRMFTSQLACQRACKQIEIVKAFGVTAKSVKRNVKKFREEGIESFYRLRKPRGATVMTEASNGDTGYFRERRMKSCVPVSFPLVFSL